MCVCAQWQIIVVCIYTVRVQKQQIQLVIGFQASCNLIDSLISFPKTTLMCLGESPNQSIAFSSAVNIPID